MISDFFGFLIGGVFDFLSGLFGILPQMPFSADDVRAFLGVEIVDQALGWANYFLPLDIAAGILALWSTAMMAYVGVKLAMKYTGEIV